KDRSDPAGQLHANFRLEGDGEYLALVRPDGTTVEHAYAPAYPQQVADISYGVIESSSTLVPEGAPVNYHVGEPSDAGVEATWADLDFDASAFSGSRQVLITEVGAGTPDYIEIQNVSSNVIDTKGWFVAVNVGTSNEINRVTETYWGLDYLDDTMDPGEIVFTTDLSGSPEYFGSNIFWSVGQKGWAMIVDGVGNVVDFVVWGYADVTLDTIVNGFPVTSNGLWNGSSASWSGVLSESTLERFGNTDNNDASDFRAIDPDQPDLPNLGQQNSGLSVPFLHSPGSSATTGVGFSTDPADFAAAVETDVESAMLGVNASLWMRIPLEVPDTSTIDMLQLRMQYNDGFVAYLDGQEIARRNAPVTPHWDSAATATRTVAESLVYEELNVSSVLGTLQEGAHMLAIHGL
ncbi:hypothetical protein LCGC14_2816240, partial [marine sediment metagenome]